MSRHRAQTVGSEQGFTLMELLVVILIIGILVSIAIPAFLNQTSKATDASAKELARTAATAAETYGTDHQGTFAGVSASQLQSVESTIPTSNSSHNAYLSDAESPALAGSSTGSNSAGASYSVTVTSDNGNTYTIARNDSGILTRSCTVVSGARSGGCVAGTW